MTAHISQDRRSSVTVAPRIATWRDVASCAEPRPAFARGAAIGAMFCRVAIAGCTSGTGLVLAKTCADLGARVILLNRKSERADAALKELQGRDASAQHVPVELCRAGPQQPRLDARLCGAAAQGVPRRNRRALQQLERGPGAPGVMGLPETAQTHTTLLRPPQLGGPSGPIAEGGSSVVACSVVCLVQTFNLTL